MKKEYAALHIAFGLLLQFFLATNAYAALDHTPSSVKAVAKAYGFVLGQEYSLERIERTYPETSMQVELARLTFNSAFPGIRKKLEAELISVFAEAKFKELQDEMGNRIFQTLEKQQLTPQLAQHFLEQVKARAKGKEMESEVLRYLLAVRYASNPVAEFADGFRQRFRTDGGGKSRGVKLTMQLPRSWLELEAERPHIVKKWTDQGGSGNTTVMLEIYDLDGYNPTVDEVKAFATTDEIRAALPEGGTFLQGGFLKHEGRPGYWLEFAMHVERARSKMYLHGYLYKLFLNGMDIRLSCMSTSDEKESEKVDAAIKLNEPVCRQVLNSLVLNQVYE